MPAFPQPIFRGRDGFALQFALIGVLFWVFADWSWALQTAGPTFICAWVFGGILQLCVALSLAAIGPRSSDEWIRRRCPLPLTWLACYLLIIGYLAAIADGEYRLAGFLLPFAGVSEYSHQQQVSLALLCLALQSPWSLCRMPRVMRHIKLAVAVHMIGIGCLLVSFLLVSVHQASVPLLSTAGMTAHEHMPRFLVTLVVPVSVLSGFYAPGWLAPLFGSTRRQIPLAMFSATVIAFLGGTLLLVAPLLLVTAGPPFPSTLLHVVRTRLGSPALLLCETLIVTGLWFRIVVLQLVATRLLATQVSLGKGPKWSRRALMTAQGLPVSAVTVCLLTPAIICLAMPDASALTFVWPALWSLSYVIIIGSRILGTSYRRLPRGREWRGRRGGMLINVLAAVWSVGIVILIPLLDVARAGPILGSTVLVGAVLALCWRRSEHGAG